MCSVHLHTGITVGQKRANFSASFNTHCLVVSQEFATLHTHTHNVRTYCSVRLFSFLLRAREASATPIGKGLFGVPFVRFFVPVCELSRKQNKNVLSTEITVTNNCNSLIIVCFLSLISRAGSSDMLSACREGEGKRLGGIDNKVIRMYIIKGEQRSHIESR